MELRSRSVLAVLWFLLAVSVTFYTSWSWQNTAIDLTGFSEEGWVLPLKTVGYTSAGFTLLMALLYWYSNRLDRAALNWLHFLGTVATFLLAWQLVVGFLLRSFPGGYRYIIGSSETAEEIARQQAQLFIWQFRSVVFLFAASQLMLVINLLTKPKPDEREVIIQKMLDEL